MYNLSPVLSTAANDSGHYLTDASRFDDRFGYCGYDCGVTAFVGWDLGSKDETVYETVFINRFTIPRVYPDWLDVVYPIKFARGTA